MNVIMDQSSISLSPQGFWGPKSIASVNQGVADKWSLSLSLSLNDQWQGLIVESWKKEKPKRYKSDSLLQFKQSMVLF